VHKLQEVTDLWPIVDRLLITNLYTDSRSIPDTIPKMDLFFFDFIIDWLEKPDSFGEAKDLG